ncbi:DUF4349 domain-containing protein [Aquimarina sediminis]|uniref:DUF4349 domain-containing protein n=1 Tax=Aquimarina sediminis TaxID=2070536 RepID=UPI000CA052AA|nr:DUF4349 domain-containing protein [Aquimarina sediminis]
MKTNKISGIKRIVLSSMILIGFSCSKGQPHNYKSENIALEETGETALLNSFETEGDLKLNNEKKKSFDNQVKIIKNGNCRLKVKNVEEATSLAKKIASKYKGYISDERFTNTNYTKENRFTIRVPQDLFDTVLDSICSFAEFVDHKNISTIDVTEEYMDISSRLKTKFEVKERYETILRTKAKTVEDILKAEEKLSQLQEEIESAQGRLKYLSNRVSYSTIQVDMYQTIIPKEEPVGYKPGFLDKAEEGLSFGWSVIENLTLLLFYIWPLLILGVAIFVYFKWIRK